jgi:hypothetical protein
MYNNAIYTLQEKRLRRTAFGGSAEQYRFS